MSTLPRVLAPRAVLFDLDGTLLDTAPDFYLALNALRAEAELPPLAHDLIRPHVSHGSPAMLRLGFDIDATHASYEARRARFLELYAEVLASATVPFPGVPEAMTNPQYEKLSSQYLEPNVIDVRGRLRVLMTVKPKRQSTAGMCAVLDFEDKGGPIDLNFTQFHPMPGGQLKFCVIWDEQTKLFWATANLVVDGQGAFDWFRDGEKRGNVRYASGLGGNDRRFLMLQYSVDGLNWFQAGCVAQAAKISQSFMYARPVIDGDDLAIIARSSIHAPNQHDADHATFHRVKNFRSLALKLVPEAEE